MKLNVIIPEDRSLQVIQSTIDQGEVIYRSPHVGNLNNSELNLAFGISAMGGAMQLELVDSIRGDDGYSNPRVLMLGGNALALASRNYAKSRVVGGCVVDESTMDTLRNLGIDTGVASSPTLRTLHVGALQQRLPAAVKATVSSEYFAAIGEDTYGAVLAASQAVINRPLRQVDEEGKLREVSAGASFDSIYGLGENKDQGVLPPLEAMMAIEVIKKVLETNGSDGQIVHVAGPDMIRYTKDPEVMDPVRGIAGRVLSALGVPNCIEVDYVVPCMRTLLANGGIERVLGGAVQSQYDILVKEWKEASRNVRRTVSTRNQQPKRAG